MRASAVVLVLVLSSCSSSARYTMPAAAINSAVAVGAAAVERSAGRCVAICTHGTTCNPRTGLCERVPADRSAYCEPDPAGGMRCIPIELRPAGDAKTAGTPASGVGVVPAGPPPAPAEASPRRE